MFIYLLHIVSLQLNFTAKVLLFRLICNSLECLYSIYTVFLLIICQLQRKCTDCYFEVFTHIRSKIWPYMDKKWGHDSVASSKVVNYFEMRKKMPLMRVLHKWQGNHIRFSREVCRRLFVVYHRVAKFYIL